MGSDTSKQNGIYQSGETIIQRNAGISDPASLITDHPNVQRLALSMNQIRVIPTQFLQLQHLRELDLSSNKMTEFPAILFQIPTLERLDLHNNQLKAIVIPEQYSNSIKELDLHNNYITTIPESFGNCTNLTALNLSVNRLFDLPFGLTKLKNLTYFNFEDNPSMNHTLLRFSQFLMNDKIRFLMAFLSYRQRNELSQRFEEDLTEKGRVYFLDHGLQRSMWMDARYFEWVRSLPYGDVGRFDLRGDPFTEKVTMGTIHPSFLTGSEPEWVRSSFLDSTGCKRPGCLNDTSSLCSYRLCAECCKSPFCQYHITLSRTQPPKTEGALKDEERVAAVYGRGFAARPFLERATLLRSALGSLREKESLPWHLRPRLVVRCRRESLLQDSYADFQNSPPSGMRNRLKVMFNGEEGRDYGGVSREWFRLIMPQICNPDIALFCESVPNSGRFQISKLSTFNPDHLNYFKFVGQVLAKAISEEYLITVPFTQAMYKRILGLPLMVSDLEEVDPEEYNSIRFIEENDPDGLSITFSVQEDMMGVIVTHELIKDGDNIEVTEDNKKDYIRRLINYKLTHGTEEQMDALRSGFYEIIPPTAMKGFRAHELEMLLVGQREIDLDDWKKNTKYLNCMSPSTNSLVKWFWEIVQSTDDDTRAAILSFATGSVNPPLGGFVNLTANGRLHLFTINLTGADPQNLPTAHTCFNEIDIPDYKSKAQLQQKLLMAVKEAGTIELV